MLHDTSLRMALDYAGVAVFAATGALAAARRGYDIVTFAFFAAITGIGGGTLRDLLIGAPVFWVSSAGYVAVCIAVAGLVWAFGERLARFRSIAWLDAVGLAAYCVIGASKAADWGMPPLVAVVMGVLSATFGGVVRDVLAGEPSVLLRKEIYVTAAVAGAGTFVVTRLLGLPDPVAVGLGVLAAFILRAGAIGLGWSLPGFAGAAEPLGSVATAPIVPIVRSAPPIEAPAEPAQPSAAPAPDLASPTESAPRADEPAVPAESATKPRRARAPKTEVPTVSPSEPTPASRKPRAKRTTPEVAGHLIEAVLEPAPEPRKRAPRARTPKAETGEA